MGFRAGIRGLGRRAHLFLDTLVDRIVSGFPAVEADALFARWDYPRSLGGCGRAISSLGDPGLPRIAAELPLAEAGLKRGLDRRPEALSGA